MEQKNIERLKLAANQFYMAVDLDKPQMSDLEFDSLRKEYESEGNSVKDLVDWEFDKSLPNEEMEELSKIQVQDNNLLGSIKSYLDENQIKTHYLNYKYDGSSIKAYYKDGHLQKILGTPDCEFGFVRTKAFWSLFPHEVDPCISSIQGEVLVDAKVYGQLARNAANGLTNSKYKDKEVAQEAFIRVYGVNFADGNWNFHRQLSALMMLPKIEITRHRLSEDQSAEVATFKKHTDVVFAPAILLTEGMVPDTPIVSTEEGVDFQVDGVVMYSESETKGFKFYYTEFADVEVLNVNWNKKPNGSYAPVLQIETCTLNDKEINKVTAGGVPNLMEREMGKGARVRVILANMTIPKVIDTIVPSDDYQWPMCDCGYQMSENDIFGSTLKCQRSDSYCTEKVSKWFQNIYWEIAQDVITDEMDFSRYFKENLSWFLTYLNIDRWVPENKFNENITWEKLGEVLLITLYSDGQKPEDFYEVLESNFTFSELNLANLDANYKSTYEVFKKVISHWGTITTDNYYKLFE